MYFDIAAPALCKQFHSACYKTFLALKVSKIKDDKSIFDKAVEEFKPVAHTAIDNAMENECRLICDWKLSKTDGEKNNLEL